MVDNKSRPTSTCPVIKASWFSDPLLQLQHLLFRNDQQLLPLQTRRT